MNPSKSKDKKQIDNLFKKSSKKSSKEIDTYLYTN